MLYSACLLHAVLPKQLPLTENSEFISVDHRVFSCHSVSVLVLLDVRDTDKLGIYSTLWFFSLLVSPKVNLMPANQSALTLLKRLVQIASFKWNAKKCSKPL